MSNTIYPCLWFDGNAKEAAIFYSEVFPSTRIVTDSPMVVVLENDDQKFMLLNGGSMFKPNPSISFFVLLDPDEVEHAWKLLIEGGNILMPLDKYEWSEKYGWVQDKYGFSWQLSSGKFEDVGQKFSPTLMYMGEQAGKAEEALQFYTSIFPDSSVVGILKYDANDGDAEGLVKHAQFKLNNYVFMIMDSPIAHGFNFNEAISIVVECDKQEEIDFFWNRLTEDGKESMCGWLKDRYGVSWQIVPSVLGKLMADKEKAPRVTNAFMKMKKFNIEELMNA